MSRDTPRALPLVLLVAVLLRLFLMAVVPLDEKDRSVAFVGYNDEPAHYNYVRYLAEERRFPVQISRIGAPDAFEIYAFEYHQPPLYYLLAVPFHWVAGVHGVRLFSVLLSLSFLWLLHLFLQRHIDMPEATIGIPLFFALLLGHARFSAQVNNDVLLWLLALFMFFLLFDVVGREAGGSVRDWAALGAVAGLGILTKMSFLTLLGGPPVALWVSRRRQRPVLKLIVFFAVAFVLAGPWLIRNMILYSEWLATSVAIGGGRGILDVERLYPVQIHHLQMLPFQFWSGFENTFSRDAQQNVMKLLVVIGAGVAVVAIRHWVLRRRDAAWRTERTIFWGLLVASAGNLVGFAYYAYRYVQGEVRMLFPSLLGLAFLVLVPLYRSVPEARQRWVSVGLVLCALLPWIGFL